MSFGMTETQARELMQRVLRLSKADACEVNLNGNAGGNVRYARNTVSTAGAQEDVQMVIQSNFGKRSGTVTLNEFTDESLQRAVTRSEELARLAPEDPEFMGPMEQQRYTPTTSWFQPTAALTPEQRARAAEGSIQAAKAKQCTAAGFWQDNDSFSAMANSKGLFAWDRSTGVNFSVTVRTADGLGSGYATRDVNDVSRLDAAAASRIATDKAVASREARAIEPGKYTVILEPEASVELIQNMAFNMGARNADEGRSFLSKPGGGTKLGEKLFDERLTITSDPGNPDVPAAPWTGDGRAVNPTTWIEKGVVKNLFYSRYWAQQKGVAATPAPVNLIMAGGTGSLEDLIRDTRRGILVTRTWYIRTVDPQTLLYTGLTRDGTFFVENGRIKHAVKNFRFNESPVIMLNNIDALAKPVRIRGNLIPPMRLRDFTFTSLSDAV
jgi:predicted Zn-dependent protease